MKPAPFDYLPCSDIAEATACLAQYGDDARILAGGQSLIAMLNMRLAEPKVLVDITRIAALDKITMNSDTLTIAATVTQASTISHSGLATSVPLLAAALPAVGHFQTRNKGTICGSLAHADPSSELPLVACVLNADIKLVSASSAYTVPARTFFTGLLQTARQPQDMIASASFPVAQAGEAFAFNEVAMRHGDFAIVAIAVKMTGNSITIGIGGGPERPEIREWPALAGEALDDALNTLAWNIDFQDDMQASAEYRRRIVRKLGRTTIEKARLCLS